MKILTAEQMRRIDQECIRGGTPAAVLMENAGRVVAQEAGRLLGKLGGQQVVVLAGPGNNGGDGLVAARYLYDAGAAVSVYLCTPRPVDDPNLALVRERGIPVIAAAEDAGGGELEVLLANATCVLDGLLGTGRLRPLEGALASALNRVRAAREKKPGFRIIAIDLPSGLDADNGQVDPACLAADNTVTLAFPKLGLFAFPGAAYTGEVTVVDIGIPAALAEGISTELLTPEWAGSALPPRPPDANKGTFGKVLTIAGSPRYVGAAYLACSGALRVGAGLVTLATTPRLQAILAARLTEVTYLPLPETADGEVSPGAGKIVGEEGTGYGVRLVGCGVGQSAGTAGFVREILFSDFHGARVIDADGLNALAGTQNWWQKLAGDAILTPHPGEMSRLSGLTVAEVQADRVNTARKRAEEWGKTVVLKGAYTVVAAPDGRCRLSPFANAGLASAGTGDVLAGAIAGLAAQGLALFDAAALGVYLHGAAGEMVRDELGDTGMLASDLLTALPRVIRQLKRRD